jgi:MEMO1 family protein
VSVREAAVAGRFYASDAEELATTVDSLIGQLGSAHQPKALIVPHAGYRYSGALAGSAYALDLAWVEQVVIIGPNHTVPLRGAALTAHEWWRTPLGRVAIDQAEVDRLANRPEVVVDDEPHRDEHCLEVQIPFLQRVLTADFKIVPLIIGEMHPEAAASLIRYCWQRPRTLLLLSTDLSHYLSYEAACEADAATADAILNAKPDAIGTGSACGRYPLRGLLRVAAEDGLRIEQLGLCNSGDMAGDRDRVVGYGAFAVYEDTA